MEERVGGRRAVSPLAVGCAATAERDQTYQCASRTTSEIIRSPAYLDLDATEGTNQLNDRYSNRRQSGERPTESAVILSAGGFRPDLLFLSHYTRGHHHRSATSSLSRILCEQASPEASVWFPNLERSGSAFSQQQKIRGGQPGGLADRAKERR